VIELVVEGAPEVLTPAEVASIFRVDAKTVTRWSAEGKLPCFKTLGGHRRYRRVHIEALLRGERIEAGS
jgi:excisionase family DNA binding protein